MATPQKLWTAGKPWDWTDAKRVAQWGCWGGWEPLFEVPITVTFTEQGGKTKQILRARVIKLTAEAAPYLAGMEAGWTQSLERLAR